MQSTMDLAAYSGSSKQRRDLLKNETDQLGKELPFDYGKVSQLRILKAACSYLKKEKHFGKLRELSESSASSLAIDNLFSTEETLRNESFSGFVVCFTKLGELVHVSNTSYEHLGLRSVNLFRVFVSLYCKYLFIALKYLFFWFDDKLALVTKFILLNETLFLL